MPPMPVRLITSLLALAILWSGFSSWEWGAVADEAKTKTKTKAAPRKKAS